MADTVPHNLDAEVSVIGGLLLDNTAWHSFELREDEFLHPHNRLAFAAIARLIERSSPADVLTVGDELTRAGHAHPDSAELADMAARVPTAANIVHYANIVRRTATQRRILATLAEQQQRVCSSAPEDIVEVAEHLQQEIISACDVRARVTTLGAAAMDAVALFSESAAADYVPSGLDLIDSVTAGWPLRYMSILAGRPSQGKSVTARKCAYLEAKAGIPVGYVALEETRQHVARNLLISVARVPTSDVIHRRLDAKQRRRLLEAHAKVLSLPLYIVDERPLTPAQACQRIRQMHAQYGIKVAYVDYWNKLSLGSEDRYIAATRFVDMVSSVADKLGIAVVVVAQLKRANDITDNVRPPRLSDLKETSALEEAGHTIVFVHREGFYDKAKPELQHEATLIIAKGKMSDTVEQTAYWEGEYLSIADCDPGRMPTPWHGEAA